MKKILFFFCVLLCSATTSRAQIWCNPGATWHYTFNGPWGEGYYRLYYSGDTNILAQPSKIITKEITYYDHTTSSYKTENFWA